MSLCVCTYYQVGFGVDPHYFIVKFINLMIFITYGKNKGEGVGKSVNVDNVGRLILSNSSFFRKKD